MLLSNEISLSMLTLLSFYYCQEGFREGNVILLKQSLTSYLALSEVLDGELISLLRAITMAYVIILP